MGDEDASGLVRQRRNLMIISLVLLFSEVAQLKVSKLSAFGNELLIGEPHAVNMALWLAGVYWLLRFYQYARPGFRNSIRNALLQYIQGQGSDLAFKKVLAENPELREPFPDLPGPLSYEIFDLRHHGITMNYEMDIELAVRKQARGPGHSIDQEYGAYKVKLKSEDLGVTKLKAWLHLIFNTTHFTELVLPYILFSLPVMYTLYTAFRDAL